MATQISNAPLGRDLQRSGGTYTYLFARHATTMLTARATKPAQGAFANENLYTGAVLATGKTGNYTPLAYTNGTRNRRLTRTIALGQVRCRRELKFTGLPAGNYDRHLRPVVTTLCGRIHADP